MTPELTVVFSDASIIFTKGTVETSEEDGDGWKV